MTLRQYVMVIASLSGAGCVEVPDRLDRDAAAAVEPGDGGPGPTDGRPPAPRFDRGPFDRGPTPDRGSMVDAGRRFDRGGAPPIGDAAPPDAAPPDAGPWCPEGSVETAPSRLCLQITACRPLPGPRADHRVVTLTGGLALLAGGTSQAPTGAALDGQSWLYDERSDTWLDAGDLRDGALHRHTLTALPDGRALLVAGDKQAGAPVEDPQHDVFIFDPARLAERGGAWTRTRDVSNRALHAAAWHGAADAVVVSGGLSDGRANNSGNIPGSQRWAVVSGGWANADEPDPGLFGHHLVGWSADTLVRFGGQRIDDDLDRPVDDGQPLLLEGDAWRPLPPGLFHVGGSAAVTPDGILLIGGLNPGMPETVLRRLGPPDWIAVNLPSLTVPRLAPGAAWIGGEARVVVVGGRAAPSGLTIVEVIDLQRRRHDQVAVDLGWGGLWTGARPARLLGGDALFVGGWLDGAPTDRCMRIGLR